jgi:hypothetical protein
MVSELLGHIRYKSNWLLAFSVNDFHSLTKDNRYALREWLGEPDGTLNEKEVWNVKNKNLGSISIISGEDGTTYNLKWEHHWGNYLLNFKNRNWYDFLSHVLKNISKF